MKFLLIVCLALFASCANGASLGLENFIVGGILTTIEEHPWTISQSYLGAHRCAGSIISTTRGLTAASCTYETEPGYTSWRTGSSEHASGGSFIFTERYITHPSYSRPATGDDIAIIYFLYPIVFSASSQPIALPAQGAGVPPGSIGQVSGWGVLLPNAHFPPTNIHYASKAILSHDQCQSSMGSLFIGDGNICAGGGNTINCLFDNGNPLVVNLQLVGIASWGLLCSTVGTPSVYTRTSYYIDWINANI